MAERLQDDGPRFNEDLSGQALLDWFFEKRDESKAFFDPIYEEGGRFWDVMAAESLSAEEKALLKELKRPDIDPPFASGIIETVIGAELSQQTEPVFHGVDKGAEDEVLADWLTQLCRNGFRVTDADRAHINTLTDMLVTGYGYEGWHISLRKIPYRPTPIVYNFWQVYPDPDAVEENLKDSKYFFVETTWELEDAVANWPDKEEELRKAAGGRGGGSSVGSGSQPRVTRKVSGGGSKGAKNTVTILEFQYRRSVKRVNYDDPETGEPKDTTRTDFERRKTEINDAALSAMKEYESQADAWMILAQSPDPGMAAGAGPQPQMPKPLQIDDAWETANLESYNGYSFRKATVAGEGADTGAILEDKELDLPLPGEEPGFTIRCLTGNPWKQYKDKRVRRMGLMRKIAPIQDWFGKFLRTYLEVMSRKAKGGGFAEVDAFEGVKGGFDGFVKNSSSPGVWHGVASGSLQAGKIRENPPVQGEPGLLEGLNVMKEMFSWVTGVSQGLQGTMTQDRPNVLVANQQEMGLQMLLPIRKPFKDFLLSVGRLYAAIALKHLPAEEIDRILGVQKVEGMTMQMIPDPQTGQKTEQPITGADGQPLTAGKILKEANLLEFDIDTDTQIATLNQKMSFFQLMNQHGFSDVLKEVLQGAAGTKIWLPRFLRNSPLPGTDAKQMADEAEAYLEQQANAESAQGILAAFQGMLQSDPQQAQQLHASIMQMLQGGDQQPPPPGEQQQ